MLFTLILTEERGLLLRASAVSENGRGSVFFGPPGSGKTTVVRLSAGRTILTDEMVIIKPHNGRYRVYGTPFCGDITPVQSNARAELTALYSLKKDDRNSLVPLEKAQAVTDLYQCMPVFHDDSQLLSRIRHICRTLVNTVPVYELRFLPDPSFWQVLDEQSLEGGEPALANTRSRHSSQYGGTR
jgi:energy-coupling factor transporter ATP-binding protein EcfA2